MWQGCATELADFIELAPARPIVRVKNVLLSYDVDNGEAGSSQDVQGAPRAGTKGQSFVVEYTGDKKLTVVYIRDGDAYQPAHAEPELPSC
jgi:hypothetical protein